ncbi:unnamed protein product, partial [Chrysoparadoxa australica]
VLHVQHFNTDLASLLVYGTQSGCINAWDVRQSQTPWKLKVPEEVGNLSAMALGTDRLWVTAGTSRGYVCLWDIRFPLLCKVWRHNSRQPIHRLATCTRLPQRNLQSPIFISSGGNEAAVWDLAGAGAASQCFRVVEQGTIENHEVPFLESVPLPKQAVPYAPILSSRDLLRATEELCGPRSLSHSMRAMVGRISGSGSYLITAGTDRCIRYWDFQVPSRSGLVSLTSLSPSFTSCSISVPMLLTTCHFMLLSHFKSVAVMPGSELGAAATDDGDGSLSSGLIEHKDAILDLKTVDWPISLLLSSSRDGVVHVYR